ncbi:glycoside hydrolase family 3 N-terminal domain-containing protein [Propioniciclava soli]|uniref:glycoside hydrolase family 3 N-terminal domain-containing protein n=1 Tax=Propioniciclava soli TaxID=2775081 RepID=UPI001E43C3EC|nr:glycoside hydrolase family 3 N-terminal domain-containing protein [Propioniciclava soli]
MTDLPYRDPSLSTAERVDDLMSRLSVEDKAGQLTQYFYMASFGELPVDFDFEALPPEAQSFAKQPLMVKDAIAAGKAGSALFVKDAATANILQRKAVEESPHGIPLIFGYDVIHGFRTIFPVPIAQAASWDPEAVEAGQRVAAREARAVGIHWAFAPMVDIARDPRWGRIIEGAGEDPCLGSAIAAAQVRGFQGGVKGNAIGDESILAGPKHFAGYGAAVGGRDYDDADISDSELRNVYLPPFKAAVDAGAANLMSAYMDLNGVPASANCWLLNDVLRDEWGFTGWVVSDANAIRSLETQHHAKDLTDAGARGLHAGNDMEMCMFDPAFNRLPDAVAAGLVSEEELDVSVRRVLTAKVELGLFEHPYADEDAVAAVLDAAEHRDAARASAEKTFVLLRNEGATLPLDADALGSIAVIGELADSPRDTLGPWVFDHDTDEAVSILAGIKERTGDGVTVEHVPGVKVEPRHFPSMFDRMDPTTPQTPEDHDDDAELARAIELAKRSDVAVVVIGQRQNQIGENASAGTLELPGRQLEQLQALVATGTPVVALVMSGRPLDLRWANEHVPAILQVWYPGTRGGEAVASALFGDVSPAGRLPITWPRHVGQVPMYHNHYRTFQPEAQGQRYWDEESTPLYPFGHGLSYAAFSYADLRAPETVAVGETATVSVAVTNDSSVDAEDVVQLYVHQRHGTSTRPIRELKGFRRVHVPAGETVTVEFELGPDQLRYWSAVTRDWVQDATVLDVWAGGSSAAELATTLEITG